MDGSVRSRAVPHLLQFTDLAERYTKMSAPVDLAYREGRLLECHELLARSPTKADSEDVLATELLSLIGRAADAEAAATRLVRKNGLSSALLARCTSVLADCRWYGGDLSAGLELYQVAVRHAETSKDRKSVV